MAGEDGFRDDPDAAVIAGEVYAWAGGVSWYIIWYVQVSGQIGKDEKMRTFLATTNLTAINFTFIFFFANTFLPSSASVSTQLKVPS